MNLLVFIFTLCLQTATATATLRILDQDYTVNIRARQAQLLIRKKSCRELISSNNCTVIKSTQYGYMQFFMASKPGSVKDLKVVKMRGKDKMFDKMGLNKLDAVVVIDPLPDAHHGHTTIIMLIRVGLNQQECRKLKGLYYPVASAMQKECMYLPSYQFCRVLQRQQRGIKEPCHFHSIPRVYDENDPLEANQLHCHENVEGFGNCPIVKNKKVNRCDNKQKCEENGSKQVFECFSQCDYAVMLSGGWNKYTNKIRHLDNLIDMYDYLRKKKFFPKEKIKIFFANNGTIDLDSDEKTQDTNPATDDKTILSHITSVCAERTACIDTFVLYLNGPTLPNGDILLWDKHSDGKAADSEILTIKELIEPFKTCGAKNVLIIADQNYAGRIIKEVQTQRAQGWEKMNRVQVITSSSSDSISWRRDFTKNFIKYDNVHIDHKSSLAPSRKISSIYKDLKKNLPGIYNVRYLSGENTDLTVTGKYGSDAGCSAVIYPMNKIWGKTRTKRSFLRLNTKRRKLPSHGT